MWTTENRGRYDRSHLRHPSDLTNEEWELVQPLIPPAKRGGNKRTVNIREIMNGIMYVLSTGCRWRAMPQDLPPGYDAGRKIKGKKRHILVNTQGLLIHAIVRRGGPGNLNRVDNTNGHWV